MPDMHPKPFPAHLVNKGRRRILGILAGAILAAVADGTGAAAQRIPAAVLSQLGYELIELRRTGQNHLFLFAQVNNRRRSCLVDTGWSFTTVSTNTAARLNPPLTIGQFKLGRVILTNEPVMVQDMRVNGRPAPYDVVLGCDFLTRHHAVIDCANNRLYLRRTAPSPEQAEVLERQLRNAGKLAIELKRHRPPALTCQAKINQQPVALLVDSGAVWSCLDAKTAAALNLQLSPSPNRIRGAGAAGQRELAVADLKQLQIGEREVRRLSVAVLNLADWGLGADGKVLENVGGILGGGELATLGAVIDCHQLKLWLQAAD